MATIAIALIGSPAALSETVFDLITYRINYIDRQVLRVKVIEASCTCISPLRWCGHLSHP
jgi:hypothetical protein